MKLLKQSFTLLAISIAFSTVHADNTGGVTTTLQPIPPQKGENPFNRPYAPSIKRIYFGYDIINSLCIFQFPAYVDYIDVTIENVSTHAMYFGHVDSSDPSMYQPLEPGSYIITCETMQGDIYEGEVFI